MGQYKIISESAAILMLAIGLVAAPLAALSHDRSTCPAPCCSHEESGCCDNQAASCAEHPFCDDCAVFSSLTATFAGSVFEDIIRSHLTVKYPVPSYLKQDDVFKSRRTVSADIFSNILHSPPYRTSTVLRL